MEKGHDTSRHSTKPNRWRLKFAEYIKLKDHNFDSDIDWMLKPIYFFDEADSKNKTLIGSKGAGLAEMTQLGLPIPPGFIITTEICAKFYEAGKRLPDGFMYEVRKAMKKLEILSKMIS